MVYLPNIWHIVFRKHSAVNIKHKTENVNLHLGSGDLFFYFSPAPATVPDVP